MTKSKKAGIIFLCIAALWFIVSLFLPSVRHVVRSTNIKASRTLVYKEISDLHEWKSWSYWDRLDPQMENEFEGPESGTGAKHNWHSKMDKVGNGSLTIVQAIPDSMIQTRLDFEGRGSSMGGITLKAEGETTNVDFYMDIEVGFLGRIFPGLMMERWLGSDFEKTLQGLKDRCEQLAVNPVGPDIKIEETTTSTQIIATHRMETNQKTMPADIGASYKMINDYIEKNKLKQAGPVFAIYHSFAPEKIDMECAIPVDKMATSSADGRSMK